MFAGTQKRISLRRLEAQVQDIESRREAIIAAILDEEERALDGAPAFGPLDLDRLCDEADLLRGRISDQAALLRAAMRDAQADLQARHMRADHNRMAGTKRPISRMGRWLPVGAKQARA